MPVTAEQFETVLRSIPGALGRQVTSLAVLASGADAALSTASTGLTVEGAAAFLATLSQESGSFRYLEEIDKTQPYSPYIGRTFEQVTHRDNYAAFGQWCAERGLVSDPDVFVTTPKRLAEIRWAWLGGVWFWQKNGIWVYGNRGDFLATQRAVNLGNPLSKATPNGITARRAWYAAWLKVGPDLLPTIPTPPPSGGVMHSARYGDYVEFRGGYFPPQTVEKLKAIPSTVRITQGGLSTAVKASSYTHAGLGCGDANTDGLDRGQVWDLAEELFSVGIIAYPRGFNWDSFQGKTIANTNDGNEHLHFLDTDEYDHLHPEAKAQVDEWKRWRAGKSKDGDGLVGVHPYYGPSGVKLGDWDKSPWNPKVIEQKELELPTTNEVVAGIVKAIKNDKELQNILADAFLGRDVIPNRWSDKDTNEFISPKTSLSRADVTVLDIQSKVDGLTALVEARFPDTGLIA